MASCTKVKICGLATADGLDAALDCGADFFGLVFYGRSPRNVSRETAAELVRRSERRALSVALLVDPPDQDVAAVVEQVAPDYIQLHGTESPRRVEAIKRLAGLPIIKAVRIADAADAESAAAFGNVADKVLFDAKLPLSDPSHLPGGNGVPFDWTALTDVKGQGNFILSGGLNPDNVSRAIEITGARTVDVSSGVERGAGTKDPDLIRRFVHAAKSAAAASSAHE